MKNIFILLLLISVSVFSQKEKDSVSTEVINVVSSYKPTISDAFKANETPDISIETNDKSNMQYGIKSHPIKSVFKPYSGGYKSAKTNYKKSEYPDYLKVGYGNYGTPLVEAFLYKRKKEHEGQVFLYNKASNGGIKDVVLSDSYLNTKIALNYKNHKKAQTWEIGASYQRDMYNWYGIPDDMLVYQDDVIASINEKQIYNHLVLKGSILLKQEWISENEARLEKFSDKHGSNETRFYYSPTFTFPIQETKVNTKVILDIIHGEFENDYSNTMAINYGFLNLGAEAAYPIEKENLYISLGAKLLYNSDLENKKGRFFIYPDIHANFALIDELLNIYGGFTGGLIQNSYRSIANENPYVSPTLNIKPTSNAFKLFAGFKGKMTSTISYDVNASYSQEKDKLLFRSNQNLTDGTMAVTKGYQAGNSFYALYDKVSTLGLYGQLAATLAKNIETGASISLFSYSMDNEAEAWNLPPFMASIFGTYSFGKWNTKGELFTKGPRKDLLIASDGTETPVELDAYVDINLSADYTFNRKWSAFIELNNILNTNYQVYSNFQVQGFQVLAGAVYRFDL
ncbi:TonB-dependent receptor [Flavicella sp.]|uniref:TonB-dependent receptor domain-containing protein n=1 Tax=Flavicella sp. TaxID=2957742 RepID=UPI00263078FE|nr:TonB-dependent receptor [Flavicella sp.]MDG1804414.1 TonB-dependent receptor [Flavicella sp.]